MPGPLGRFPERRLIVGMNSLDEFFHSGQTIPWIKTQNAVAFLRPMPDVSVGTPGPTACVAKSLRFCQVRFTAPEGLLRQFSVLDVEIDSVPLDDVPRFVSQRVGTKQEPAICAVKTTKACFSLSWFSTNEN